MLLCAELGGKAGARQQLADQVEREYLVGEETYKALWQKIASQPKQIVDDYVIGIFKRKQLFHVLTERATLHAAAVIIATGARPTQLGIAHEHELIGHGLGYSITTHAHLAAGRDVAVVGSTARALRGVAELLHIATRVVLIAPFRGVLNSALGQRLRADRRVDLLEGYTVTEIESSAGAVHAIQVTRNDRTQRLPVQAVFVDLGLVPNSQMVRQLVQLDERGFILIGDQNQTSLPGLFAAGDVTSATCEQIMIAIGAGARAAQSAYEYILAERLGLESAAIGQQ
jgi:thioredoxin reductase (NADPH)/alkyl hydroperoxide reductase subunit F